MNFNESKDTSKSLTAIAAVPEVTPEAEPASKNELATRLETITAQLTALIGLITASFALIGTIWIAFAAASIPNGGESLATASLPGLVSLVAFGGIGTCIVAVLGLGLSGWFYGLVFGGSDKIGLNEKTLLRWRFLPEIVLFAGLPFAVSIAFALILRFPSLLQYLLLVAIIALVLPMVVSIYFHIISKDRESLWFTRALRTVFATLIFGIPVILVFSLVRSTDASLSPSMWFTIAAWVFVVFFENYCFAIGGPKDWIVAGFAGLCIVIFYSGNSIVPVPLRLYHLIDFQATLFVANGAEDDARRSLSGCPNIIKLALPYASHKYALTYRAHVLNSIGDKYVLQCGPQRPHVVIAKTTFSSTRVR